MKPLNSAKNSAGFTLVEILVAVMVTGIIFTFIYGAMTSSLAASKNATERMEISHIGRFIIDRMSRDLSMAWPLPPNSDYEKFTGRHSSIKGKSMDEVHFTAFTRSFIGNLPQIDQAEIGYFFRQDANNRLTLMRRESEIIEGSVDMGGTAMPIYDLVDEMSIKYLRNGRWLENWDSKSMGRFPEAVSVEVTLTDGKREYFFSSITRPHT